MDPLGLLVAMLLALRFFLVLFLLRQCWIEIDLGEFVDQIRKHKCIRIVWVKEIPALLRQISFVRFLIDREEEFFLECEQLLFASVLIKRQLRFIHRAALVRIFHHAQKLFVARLTKLHFEHEQTACLDIALLKFFDCVAGEPVAKHVLLSDQLLDQRFPFVVLMCGNRCRATDDERRPRFVDENRIDFIDNGIAIAALHLLLACGGHAVVAQIIETELTVRPVGNVHRVLLAADIGFLIVLNAANRQPEETVKLPHPFGVAPG